MNNLKRRQYFLNKIISNVNKQKIAEKNEYQLDESETIVILCNILKFYLY